MDLRFELVFILVLVASTACIARQLEDNDVSAMKIMYPDQVNKCEISKEVSENENLCTLCEEFTSQAIDYVAKNKTQTEIIVFLHVACSQLHTFKRQCSTLVDYYAPLFFSEVSSVEPATFCRKVDLCKQIASISSQLKEDSCGFCQNTVSDIESKMKDPDMQIKVLEMLLKACNSMQNYEAKCKRAIFQYGPLIMANAEKFLETADICNGLHACSSEASAEATVSLHSDS